jgi:hypothetical protein
MKLLKSRILWGVLLVAGGIALLLENIEVLRIGGLIWGVVLVIAGIIFLAVYFEDRVNWWPLVPGISLLGAGFSALLSFIAPSLGGFVGGSSVLGGIGLSFFLVYLVSRNNWWAIIPAGVLATLAVVSIVDAGNYNFDTGGIFFIGVGITFLLIAVLPTPVGQMKWAFIPGLIMIVMGTLISSQMQDIMLYVWPVLIILVGGYLVFRAIYSSRAGRQG